MAELKMEMPIVFITGHGDVATSVRAMKAGAVEFLTKPFGERDLLDAIRQAIDRDKIARQQHAELSELRRRYASLTPRSEEHTSELQSRLHLVCRLLLEKKKKLVSYSLVLFLVASGFNLSGSCSVVLLCRDR